MKIAAFSVRQDEKQYFDTFANVYKVELQINSSGFTADDIESTSVSGQSDITVLTLRQQSALESVLHTADIRHIQLPIIQ